MKEQVEKLREIEKEICKSKGSFELFALFLREDTTEWDLIISSDWARLDKKATIKYIVEKIKKVFSDQEMLMLSRLIILDKDNAALEAIHGAMQVEHGLAEISNSAFFGLAIKHAYLITSKKQVHS
ncbi:MAG: hypothetical protein QM487_14965 [Candidatus Marithrix sp.]